jgi:hypothetical protein
MSDDIFHSWKDRRFVIVDPVVADNERLVVLSDVSYWAFHVEELIEWCQTRNAQTQGMTITFGDDITLTEFVLRWS